MRDIGMSMSDRRREWREKECWAVNRYLPTNWKGIYHVSTVTFYVLRLTHLIARYKSHRVKSSYSASLFYYHQL